MAGKPGFARTSPLFLRSYREANRVHRQLFSGHNNKAVLEHDNYDNYGAEKSTRKKNETSCWIPHPRTGIYVPKGQEWMMVDVPATAASFHQTYWLRNVDGVDKPDPDNLSSDNYLATHLH